MTEQISRPGFPAEDMEQAIGDLAMADEAIRTGQADKSAALARYLELLRGQVGQPIPVTAYYTAIRMALEGGRLQAPYSARRSTDSEPGYWLDPGNYTLCAVSDSKNGPWAWLAYPGQENIQWYGVPITPKTLRPVSDGETTATESRWPAAAADAAG